MVMTYSKDRESRNPLPINLSKTELKKGVAQTSPRIPETEGRILKDARRRYQRVRHTPFQKSFLSRRGLQHVQSSNVSAVGVKGNDLIIRFHNGSVYRYFGKANLRDKLLKSNSKGKWVWKNLRKAGIRYQKLANINFPDDIKEQDEKFFDAIENRYNRIGALVGSQILSTITDTTGLNLQKIIVGGLALYQPIKEVNNGM